MSDLTKITTVNVNELVGANSTGVPQTPVGSDTNGNLFVTVPDKTGSGTISTLNGTVAALTSSCSSITFDITGTWIATLVIEGTTGDSNWFGINGDVDVNDSISGSFTTNTFVSVPCGSFQQVRIRSSLYTSGAAIISWVASIGTNTVEVFNTNSASLQAQVSGNITSGSSDSGNPIKIGGVYNSTLPTVASGNRVDLQLDNNGRLLTSSLSLPTTASKFSFGQLTTTTSVAYLGIESTVYTEPTTNSAMTLVSANANDTSAGTGARTVIVTYFDQTGAGPNTTTLTLNGVTPVTASVSDMCFIEKITVATVGSTGSNVGILTLKTGGAVTVGTIAATINQTFWAHHYVPTGKICYISGFSFGNNSTAAGNGAQFILKASTPTIANTPELQISDILASAGVSSSDVRNYLSPIQVAGPARVRAYVLPFANANTIQFASFDFIDN